MADFSPVLNSPCAGLPTALWHTARGMLFHSLGSLSFSWTEHKNIGLPVFCWPGRRGSDSPLLSCFWPALQRAVPEAFAAYGQVYQDLISVAFHIEGLHPGFTGAVCEMVHCCDPLDHLPEDTRDWASLSGLLLIQDLSCGNCHLCLCPFFCWDVGLCFLSCGRAPNLDYSPWLCLCVCCQCRTI